ncbi:MAG: hypothetical protein KIT56_10870, partial [Gammaproteobacteria bacterium]|nr:hypothetical protein [Gammaproteobacteria bacterium]
MAGSRQEDRNVVTRFSDEIREIREEYYQLIDKINKKLKGITGELNETEEEAQRILQFIARKINALTITTINDQSYKEIEVLVNDLILKLEKISRENVITKYNDEITSLKSFLQKVVSSKENLDLLEKEKSERDAYIRQHVKQVEGAKKQEEKVNSLITQGVKKEKDNLESKKKKLEKQQEAWPEEKIYKKEVEEKSKWMALLEGEVGKVAEIAQNALGRQNGTEKIQHAKEAGLVIDPTVSKDILGRDEQIRNEYEKVRQAIQATKESIERYSASLEERVIQLGRVKGELLEESKQLEEKIAQYRASTSSTTDQVVKKEIAQHEASIEEKRRFIVQVKNELENMNQKVQQSEADIKSSIDRIARLTNKYKERVNDISAQVQILNLIQQLDRAKLGSPEDIAVYVNKLRTWAQENPKLAAGKIRYRNLQGGKEEVEVNVKDEIEMICKEMEVKVKVKGELHDIVRNTPKVVVKIVVEEERKKQEQNLGGERTNDENKKIIDNLIEKIQSSIDRVQESHHIGQKKKIEALNQLREVLERRLQQPGKGKDHTAIIKEIQENEWYKRAIAYRGLNLFGGLRSKTQRELEAVLDG